jgi:peptidoglycan/xylan/chitin deacetylase (PgdA/CDA1 family)
MWDVLSKDYNRSISPDKIIKNVKRNLQPGSIIVFHDSLKAKNNLLVALPPILHHLREEGYTMSVIPY